MINKKAETDIKSILIGLMFVVLISSLVFVMVSSFITNYHGVITNETSYNQTLVYLESVRGNETEYQDLMNKYSSDLFNSTGSTGLTFIDMMWTGGWSILKQTAALPGKVLKLFTFSLVALGVPSEVSTPILIFVFSVMTLIIIFAVIFRLPGGTS